MKIVERKLPDVPSYRVVVVVAAAAVAVVVVVDVGVVALRAELGLSREDEVKLEVASERPLHYRGLPGSLVGWLVDLQVDQVRDGPDAVVRDVGRTRACGPASALDRSWRNRGLGCFRGPFSI